jgi:DinB superfamily
MKTLQTQKTAVSLVLVVLALTTVSAWAQTPAPATLSPEEREFALKNLQTTRDRFLQSIAGLSEKQWTFKPGPDRWSVAEVAEHITVAESAILGLIQKQVMASPAAPEKCEQVKGKDEMILQRMPDRSHKAQAPELLRPAGRGPAKRT